MMKYRALLLASAFGLGMAVPVAAQDMSVDTVVATVGGTEITIGHMIAMSLTLSEEQRELPPAVIFEGVLERLIQQEAVGQTLPQLSKYSELYLDNERRTLLASEALSEMADTITVTPEEVEEVYEARYANYVPTTEFNASHILLETEEAAMEVLDELKAGADFAELARERSIGPSGPNGGELGWFGPGRMVPEFETAVAALEKGQFDGPVKTQFGWHIVILNDSRELSKPTLDEAREQLQRELGQQKLANEVQVIVDAAPKERKDISEIDPTVLEDRSLIGR